MDNGRQDNEIISYSDDYVKEYMYFKFGLSKNNKIKGRIVETHDEAFYFWRELINNNKIKVPFEVIHVDTHSDLGLGCGWIYFFKNHMHKKATERCYPERGRYKMNEGNYLLYAISCNWINKLTLVKNDIWKNDLMSFCFKDNDPDSGYIQLKKYSEADFNLTMNLKKAKPLEYDNPVKFEIINENEFKDTKKYDYIVVSRSPRYTPVSSDELIPVFEEMINPI